ncbi:hypothetical protein TNCV_2572181 [Trichonephila clavipes]|nr:hypothetical protein TNCV_2572181 [Trichonephila clavipes]
MSLYQKWRMDDDHGVTEKIRPPLKCQVWSLLESWAPCDAGVNVTPLDDDMTSRWQRCINSKEERRLLCIVRQDQGATMVDIPNYLKTVVTQMNPDDMFKPLV